MTPEKPMKIAYFFSSFPQVSTTFLQREVRALRREGINPVLVANRSPDQSGYHPSDIDLRDETFYLASVRPQIYLTANCKRLFKSPIRYLKGIMLAFSLRDKEFPRILFRNITRLAGAAVLADFCEQNRVSHVHVHFAFGAAGVAIFLDAISKISYSISIHGSDVLLPQPLTEEKLKRARFIISNCRFHIQNLIERYPSLNKQRFHTVYLGIDTDSRLWSKQAAIPKDGKLHILNVAMLKPVKGQDILICACAHLKEKGIKFECRIVGEGPQRNVLESLIDQLNLYDSVFLLGVRYEEEVAELFDWAHLMVLSSLSEGTPMAIIEAMMKSRPVIAPRITAIPEMIVEGETGSMFTKSDPNDLADKLSIFADRPNLVATMGKEGRKRAELLFDLQRNAEKLAILFRQNACTENELA
jgi:glycosyltransferase involved in cell wall biosynthesis